MAQAEKKQPGTTRVVGDLCLHRYSNTWDIPFERPCSNCEKPTIDETIEGKYICLSCGHVHNFTF